MGTRERLETWRRLGPVRGSRAAAGLVLRPAASAGRRARLRLRPLRATPGAVRSSLGGLTAADALRGPVLSALPTVARWEEDLGRIGTEDRDRLLAVAEAVTAHRFDLLGSGPVELGPAIDWRRDFKSGREWPLEHVSRLPAIYDDDSDIKVPWELSRFQHLPVLAAAHRVTGERRYLEEIGAELTDWIDSNPVEFGPNWASTMDVAIRASNWVAALALCAEPAAAEPWLESVIGSLLLHGRFIRGHLEWAEARGNHYLSDVVGLLPVAALFAGGREGRGWAEWAAAELVSEMEHQVRADGCDHEASIPYHRLVCELFVCGTDAVDALIPGALPDRYRERLELMLSFVRDYTRPDGLAPQVGDADDGRFLPLGDYGQADPRSHLHLFGQASRSYAPAEGHAAYPDGGYWVMRSGPLQVTVRCGDVGVGRHGPHAHNDQLSFELSYGGQPVIVDPGAFIYTADPAARELFRSTSFHATLRVGGIEQQEPVPGTLFGMRDRARAEHLYWEADGDRAVFEGLHHGFERLDPPALHERRLELDAGARTLTIHDAVVGEGSHELEWTFPLPPCEASASEGSADAALPGAGLRISSPGLDFSIEPGWYSPSYGVRVPAPFIRARRRGRPGRDVTEIALQVDPR